MEQQILGILRGIVHPALEQDIVSAGIVEDVRVDSDKIRFRLVWPGPDPLSASIKKSCEEALAKAFPDKKAVIVDLVRQRKTKKTVGELDDKQLQGVSKIIAVASGKGGVGKSTVAVNLAVALARKGYRVGLADADIYGPSVPKMTGTEEAVPEMEPAAEEGGVDLLLPIEKYGVKWMSIGYFATPEQALIWRGPMACNALKQMILQVKWGELDYLLIDLPPGTGDIAISLVHDITLSGALIVTTPGDVALADVVRGTNMFRHKDVNVPVAGLVENMAWFTPAELPDHKYYIFGKDGGARMAAEAGIPLLGQVPLYISVREGGDTGAPVALGDGPDAKAFLDICDRL
ncbi:MAG: P-loop NTPase [Bacteroidales bacterium]|nr:P-loop NTPase [Bacteroidales bacterium]